MADQTYERLKESIYSGDLQPGQKIVERNLAQSLGVSRIPLRESLVRLENEGLIRSVPFSSTYVEDYEPADSLEIYSLRQLLEPLATRLAAVRADDTLVPKLRALCDDMVRCMEKHDSAGLDEVDYAFHHSIVVASGHKRLLRAYDSAHIRIVGPRVNYAHLLTAAPNTTANDHLAIIERIAARDGDGAERAAAEHVAKGARTVEAALGMSLEQMKFGDPA